MDDDEVVAVVAGVVIVLDEEEAELNQVVLAMARLAVADIMQMEEGIVYDEQLWKKITVNLNEYHEMGDPCFGLHFRMTRAVFERLTDAVFEYLVEKGKVKRKRTPFRDIMMMVVWLMATPDSFRSVALRFGRRPSTLYYFYTYVIETLRVLAPRYIKWPDRDEREIIKNRFEAATHFPGVIGCIDGSHIYITAPLNDAASYRNRDRTYSMNIQATVDSTLLVRDLYVGEPGSLHDARVFRRSQLGQKLLINNNDVISPDEHLLGDGAYTLTDSMMVPFKNNGHLTAAQINFNKRLSQGRVRVENSFGKAKGKWRRLKFLHARNPQNVVDHITASFVVHNFIILNGEAMIEDEELARPIRNHQVLGNEEFAVDNPEEDLADLANVDLEEFAADLEDAKIRGAEKRQYIMTHLLPPMD